MIKNKLLILGGNGFLGKNIAEKFLNNGWKVYSFDIQKPDAPDSRINYITGNFFNNSDLQTAVSGKDLVIHAISTVNPGNSNARFMQGYENDLLQTVRLCSMLIGTATKMIFLSSGGTVYGNQEIQPINETALARPINHYGCVKLCIENILRTFNTQFKTKFLIARVANPYGPGQDYLKGVGFIDAALKKAINNEKIEIWGDGETVRDYIYITDVCNMIYSLWEYSGPGDTFNISSGEGVSQNEIINILKDLGYNPSVIYKSARNVDAKKMVLENKRILSVYNEKTISIKEGIQKYCNYLLGK